MHRGNVASGILQQEIAQRWIDEVRPLAVALLRDQDRREASSVNIRACGRDPVGAPHGTLMLTWPVRDGREAVINHLVDCRPFLRLYERLLDELPHAGESFRTVVEDGSRLRIAVTNDVLQVLAPGPSHDYSMIRHHALMLLVAHLWLPAAQQLRWAALYRASVGLAAQRYQASAAFESPRQYLDDLEREAFAALDELAAQGASPARAGDPEATQDRRLHLALDYMQAANAAVAVLIDDYSATPPQNRTRWLQQELAVGYRLDDYLLDRWHTIVSPKPGATQPPQGSRRGEV
ncbi:MAG TPA: hypothetical protein VGS60_12795 [Actinomycetes bacterium]|jgi:hypothetical protein|nr:hypothetical protein [Actinomycetes bacterium]